MNNFTNEMDFIEVLVDLNLPIIWYRNCLCRLVNG